jgi:hypothetical protein
MSRRDAAAAGSASPVTVQRSPERSLATVPYAGSVARAARRNLADKYAEVLAAAAEAMATPPAIRTGKIRGIRDRLSRGEYSPTGAAIAGRLVGV